MFGASHRLLRDLRATEHLTLQRNRIHGDNRLLHAAYLKNGYKSCMWASADVVRSCRLARGGAQPVAVPATAGGAIQMFNLNQLINFARTATGKWFPPAFHRELLQRQFGGGKKLRYKSNVRLLDTQLAVGELEVLPGETPATVRNVDGTTINLFNSAQLVPTAGDHTYHSGTAVHNVDDQAVLQYVAAREGFTSKMWVSATYTGLHDGVMPLANVENRMHGTTAMYNMDQLVWPIPVPAQEHSWGATGRVMLLHEQVALERVRQHRGFASRRWYSWKQQVNLNNVRPDAVPVPLHTLTNSVDLLNRDQLLAP
jgi:hypothetical protein